MARRRSAGPLVVSLLGHTTLLAAGLVATLLIPATPPAPPAHNPPAFSVELAIAPVSAAPPSPPADLADAAPLPQPPPDALVVLDTTDMAAALPISDALLAPVPVPSAAELAVLADPGAPPAPVLALPPAAAPARAYSPAHSRPAPSPPDRKQPRPTAARTARTKAVAQPAPSHPSAQVTDATPQPAAVSPVADAAPLLIANPRFRRPPRPPTYPRRAVEMRAEGETLIGALLDPTGTPHDVRVLRSSGHPLLDRAALEAVGGWAFEPGRHAGQPVAARVEIPVRFTLR